MIDENNLKLLIKCSPSPLTYTAIRSVRYVDASPYINHPISLASILCNEAHVMDVNVIGGALFDKVYLERA